MGMHIGSMFVPTTNTFPIIHAFKKSAIITLHTRPQTKYCNSTTLPFDRVMKLPSVSSQNTLDSTRYEPKSVLDIRRSPPSPLIDFNSYDYNNSSLLLSSSSEEDKHFEYGMMNHFELEEYDSDSLIRELGLYDHDYHYHLNNNININNNNIINHLPDLPPFLYSDFETLNPYFPYSNQNIFELMSQHADVNEFDFTDDLIMLAECFETQSCHLAHEILTRLNKRLSFPNGKPLQRAAFYFKEAIQCLLTGSTRSFNSCTSYEIVQVIKAQKAFSTVSPIPMFSSFTANQLILDAVDGAMNVHVIDFDIGFGNQWASFLKAVAEKAAARKVNPPAVRITAVVPEEYVTESRLIRENLYHFCTDLKLRFEIDFVSIRAFEIVSFKAVKFVNGEKTAVLLSPMIFRRVGVNFVNDVRRVSPNVVVFVDDELSGFGFGPAVFRQTVIDGLKMFTTILESLEAVNVGGGEWMRCIEMFVLLPRIMEMVEYGGRNVTPWREALVAAGMKAVGMSRFAEFQAEGLVRRVQGGGFHVAKQQAEMVLCWHDRPLVATSAWTC